MNKEDILKKSREENQYGDERERYVMGVASRVSLGIGGTLSVLLVLIGEFLLDSPQLGIAGWMVFLGMYGGNYITLYKYFKKKKDLFFGIMNIIISIASIIVLIAKG